MVHPTHTCAIDSAQKTWCWGSDNFNQIGNGAPTANQYSPVMVAGDHTVTDLGTWLHACTIDTGHKAWCWGYDLHGQVGDGDDDEASEPAPVAVAGGHSFTRIATGGFHTCALDQAGGAWCWGYDVRGQVGDGNDGQADQHEPVEVSAGMLFAQ